MLVLNLNNTCLDANCSAALEKAMKINKTCIILDIENNKKMSIADVRSIQESLMRNKEAYDKERFQEWIERKKMFSEQSNNEQLVLNEEVENKKEEFDERFQRKLEKMNEELDKDV